MLYPKITKHNNRRRGPLETSKQNNLYCDIANAMKELSDESSKMEDVFDKTVKEYEYGQPDETRRELQEYVKEVRQRLANTIGVPCGMIWGEE